MANAILRKEVIRHLAQGHGLSVLAITTPPNKALQTDRGPFCGSETFSSARAAAAELCRSPAFLALEQARSPASGR
jgi:hypothetical protein